MDLDELLDLWTVGECDELDVNHPAASFIGWYHVSNEDGIVSYFSQEKDALAFRLWKINQALNG